MSQADFFSKPHIKVTGSRTIPTKPYGNEKWEITIECDLEDDKIIGQEVYALGELVSQALDQHEHEALDHANQS